MSTRQLWFLALLVLILGLPATGRAQQVSQDVMSSALIGRAFNETVEGRLGQLSPPDAAATEPVTAAAPVNAAAPNDEVHPAPAHTGLAALVHTTWDDFKAFPRRRSTWVILGVGTGLALAVHPIDDDVNAHLVGSKAMGRFWAPGKFIGAAYTQAAVSIGLYTIGRYVLPASTDVPSIPGSSPRTNKWSHMGFDLLRAQIVSQTFVQGTKFLVRRNRPTGECCSFPSGHAATAFAAASVIERHFGYRMSIPTFLVATYVGTSRLHDNRHFLSDVVFGAALGTATGWTVVGRHGRTSFALSPVPVRGGMALQLTRVDRGAKRSDGL